MTRFTNWLLLSCLIIPLTSCISSQKTVTREAALNSWLTQAEKPVRVINQTSDFRCAPGYNCYTLVDQEGQVYYAKNVRLELPREIPAK